jgi:methylated-DNA-[protein]-cysteine S-methyltransferase
MLELFLDRAATPLGEAVMISDAGGALRLFYWDDPTHRWKAALLRRYGEVALKEKTGAFGHAEALARYFDGDIGVLDAMAVAFEGSPFQKKVWHALRRIEGGATTSYAALAKKIGAPSAVRAVGLANGQNPVALVVPCHRVIGSDGSLTGYGGGLPRKRWLLDHEAKYTREDLFSKKVAT